MQSSYAFELGDESVRLAEVSSPDAVDPVRILLIDDDIDDAYFVRTMIDRTAPGEFLITHAERLFSGMKMLQETRYDAVLLDHRLPDGTGIGAIEEIIELAQGAALVMMTGIESDILEMTALQRGAQDYLLKEGLSGQGAIRAIRHAIERNSLQQQVHQARQRELAMQRQFLSHVSHELRSPVAAMFYSAANLADGILGKVKPGQEEALEIIINNARQLRRLVNDLLDSVRAGDGRVDVNVQRLRVEDPINDAVSSVRSAAGVKGQPVHVSIAPDVPAVVGDEGRIRQILINLLDNALKYSERGPIIVGAEPSPTHPGEVVISVSDEGDGISPEDVDRIFDRLVQVADTDDDMRRGLGLGLYLSRQFADAMGGSLSVESVPREGSTFRLSLPVAGADRVLEECLMTGTMTVVRVQWDPADGQSAEAHRQRTIELLTAVSGLELLAGHRGPGSELVGVTAETDHELVRRSLAGFGRISVLDIDAPKVKRKDRAAAIDQAYEIINETLWPSGREGRAS